MIKSIQNTPSIFNNPALFSGDLRVLMKDGDPWFVAKDVSDALGFTRATDAIKYLDEDEKGVMNHHTPGGIQPMSTINESGLYSLILRSRKPEAKAFKKWITSVVLPTLRKDGMYVMGEEKVITGELEETKFILHVMTMLKDKTERLTNEKLALEAKVAELAPKALVYDAQVASREESVSAFARRLAGVNSRGIKRDLVALGFLYKRGRDYLVYSRYRDVLFSEKFIDAYERTQIILTPRGQEHLVKLYFEGKLTMRANFTGSLAIKD